MKIGPLGDRVLVKRIEEEEKTKGGIIIPDTAKEKPQEGRVIAVGNGKVLENGKQVALEVTTGDRILFSEYSGSDIKLDGEEHLIVRESDILGVIERVRSLVFKIHQGSLRTWQQKKSSLPERRATRYFAV